MNIRMKSNDEQQSCEGKVLLLGRQCLRREWVGWVAGVGAGSREERIARRCGVDYLSRCCGAANPFFSKCDDVRLVIVGQVIECGNMFRDEHGASVEGADEEVCRVGGTWIWLDITTEKQCGGE